MKQLSYIKIIQSPMLQFSVGERQTLMTVHKALITEHPSSLQYEFTHAMKEAAEGTAKWDDVDEATFARFAQYLYTGDYAVDFDCVEISPEAAPNDYEESIPIEEDTIYMPSEEPADDSGWGGFGARKKPSKRKSGKSVQRSLFQTLPYPRPPTSTTMEMKPNSSLNNVHVIEGHARLYVLAEKYGLETLKAVVLHKLHSTLCRIDPLQTRSETFIDVVKYIYEHTPTRPKTDGLRELIINYIIMEAKQIAGLEECRHLIGENGDFAKDLLASLLK